MRKTVFVYICLLAISAGHSQTNLDPNSVKILYPYGSTDSIMRTDCSWLLHAEDTLSAMRSVPVAFVKTNVLYDLVTCINLSVEIPLTKRLSIEGTFINPWWHSMKRHRTLQIRYFGLSPRYYIGKGNTPYSSFFAGITAGMAKYDLQWTLRGVQGTMWHVSPVIGYTHHISKRWKMEYSAAAGYVHTKYQKYTQKGDTPYGEIKVHDYPWVSHLLTTVVPTSLNVSLVYSINRRKEAAEYVY